MNASTWLDRKLTLRLTSASFLSFSALFWDCFKFDCIYTSRYCLVVFVLTEWSPRAAFHCKLVQSTGGIDCTRAAIEFPGKIVEHILIHCWSQHQLLCTLNPFTEICYVFFKINIWVPFPVQNKCLLTSSHVSALCLDFEISAILQALHIRALLSSSSQEMKFDSSS